MMSPEALSATNAEIDADIQRLNQIELQRRMNRRTVAVREELRAALGDTLKQARIDRIADGVLAVIANYDA